MLSEDGREQIAKDAEVVQEAAGDAAYNLGAEGVTQFLYDIDDANISAALKDNAEETLDLLIASDVDPAVAKALLTNPEFYNTVESILSNEDALGEGSQLLSDTSENTEQPPHTPGQPLDITITEGLSTTPVQNVLLGLKDVEGFVSGLPAEEAQVAMIGLGLLTGGVVKNAVDVAKDTVVDTALGAQIRDLQQNVAKVVAAGAANVDVGTHERLMEVESGNGFSTDLQTGSEFGLEVIGLGTGVVLTKKGSGDASSALPQGYQRHADGTISGPGGGKAVDTGYQADGRTVYQRQGEEGPGSYYTINDNGTKKPIESPRSKTEIGERREHHNSKVEEIAEPFESDGDLVVYDGSITGSCGTTCKPDIFHMSQDGSVNFVEVKTGDAGFSPNQSKVIEQFGVDSAGNPQYRIPPDATPSGELMRVLDDENTGTLAELGYPNGIPVKVIRTEGVGG